MNNNNQERIELHISIDELMKPSITSALELYENELKWDTEIHFRAITIQFEEHEHAAEQAHAKYTYFKELVEACPEYIYFLNPAQFKEVFHVLFVDYCIEDELERTQETMKLIDFEKYAVTKQFKQFILESLEDMPTFHQAPAKLVEIVYNDVQSFNCQR